jgi:putative membrane protein
MKTLSIVTAGGGFVIIAGLVAYFGVDAVAHALVSVGWFGFAAICLIHLSLIAIMGIAWRVLLPGTKAWASIWGRLVRDSGSEVLPLSQVGGYVLGARAIALAGVSGTNATASTIVDVTLEFLAQLAYTAIGLLCLIALRPESRVAGPIAAGLALAAVVAAMFLFVQRRGFDLLGRLAQVLGQGWADKTAAGAAALHAAIAGIYGRRPGVWAGFVLHLSCWVTSAVEAWLALRLAGAPLGFGTVLIVESLLYAIRTLAFMVPNAIGVQEAAYVLLGGSFGLTPEMALALSLLKRARDITIGLPTLGAWQALESGRFWRRA